MATADRVQDTSTSTGTGNFVLSGSAPAGFRPLSAIPGGVGATFGYVIENGAEWEVGIGTITAANTFSRAPSASSNAGQLVNFSAGTKTVYHSITAAQFAQYMSAGVAAFATSIPLTRPGNTYMPQQVVASVLAFSAAANPVQGALVYLRLVADGANAPTFTGFKEWGGSLGYDNRAGIANEVQFFYDGYDYWYSISQAVGAVAEPVAATAVTLSGPTSGVVNTASSNYTVGTNGTRSGSVVVTPTPVTNVTFTPSSATLPAGTSTATFTATSTTTGAKTIAVTNNGGLSNPSNITLTVAAAATAPAAPTIGTAVAGDGYIDVAFTHNSDGGSAVIDSTATLSTGQTATGTTSPIRVTAPNGTAATATVKDRNAVGLSAASAASNSVTPAAAVVGLRLTPKDAALAESGSAGAYQYQGTQTGFDSNRGVFNKAFQSGTDGSASVAIGGVLSFLMGVQSSSSPTAYTSMLAYIYATGGTGNYVGSAGGTAGTTTAMQSGDVVKLSRAGSVLTAQVARAASPTTFVTVWTWTGFATGVVYAQFSAESGNTVSNLASSGLV